MTNPHLTISPTIQRQFILGKQGLWPGRRWTGKAGVELALRETELLQMDPVSVIAPSHEIVLWGRVVDFQPADLYSLLYEDRKFFDYGGWLAIYPMEELPYWRDEMEKAKGSERWANLQKDHPGLADAVKAELRARGPLRSRDLGGNQVNHYRAGKDTGVALFYLWLTGELMTYNREGKERVYDFLENVAPPHLHHAATSEESTGHFLRKAIAHNGFVKPKDIRNKTKLAEWVKTGEVIPIQVEGEKHLSHLLAKDLPLLETLLNGQMPRAWKPLGATTLDEIVFLSPLEYVSARGRAKILFGFEYIWEIYKPAPQRKYGPYTLPILYGDQLVGRTDMKFDRQADVLRVNGFWLEGNFTPDEAFAEALARGFARFKQFLGAGQLDANAIQPDFLRARVGQLSRL